MTEPADPTRLLLDRQQIHDALVAYCWGIDFGDWELMRSVFTPDAHLATSAGDVVDGADQIVALMQRSRSNFLRTQHLVTNHRAEITGDTAHGTSYVVGFDVTPGEPEKLVRIVGAYHDDLVRGDGCWLISDRRISRTWLDPH